MVDQELLEQFHILIAAINKLPTEEQVQKMIDERARHTEILIENTVTKRIDSLIDGYMLTHEKQYELERRVERLEQIVVDLQNRIA